MSLIVIYKNWTHTWEGTRPPPLTINQSGAVGGGYLPGTPQFFPDDCGGGNWWVGDACGAVASASVGTPDHTITVSRNPETGEICAGGNFGKLRWTASRGTPKCVGSDTDANSGPGCSCVNIDMSNEDPCDLSDLTVGASDSCGESGSITVPGSVFALTVGFDKDTSTIMASGGVGPYTFAASPGDCDPDTGHVDFGDNCGTATVSVQDDCGNTAEKDIALSLGSWHYSGGVKQDPSVFAGLPAYLQQQLCPYACDGTTQALDVTETGWYYYYYIPPATGPAAGLYKVTVTWEC